MHELIEKSFYVVGGAFISLLVNHFVLGKDVSFIKGQLSLVMGQLGKTDKLFETLGKMEKDLVDKKHSLDSAHEKIRGLQEKRKA
jgi:hypothetical protein